MISTFFFAVAFQISFGSLLYFIGRAKGREQVAPTAELVAELQTVEVHQGTEGTVILLRLVNPQAENWNFMSLPMGPVSVRVDR